MIGHLGKHDVLTFLVTCISFFSLPRKFSFFCVCTFANNSIQVQLQVAKMQHLKLANNECVLLHQEHLKFYGLLTYYTPRGGQSLKTICHEVMEIWKVWEILTQLRRVFFSCLRILLSILFLSTIFSRTKRAEQLISWISNCD